MHHFYTSKLKAASSKKSAFYESYAYFKTGLPAFIVCFVLQSSLQAQAIFVTPTGIESNPNNSVNNN